MALKLALNVVQSAELPPTRRMAGENAAIRAPIRADLNKQTEEFCVNAT